MFQVDVARPIDVAKLMGTGTQLEVASVVTEQDQLKFEGDKA
jgi:hypothetical protein